MKQKSLLSAVLLLLTISTNLYAQNNQFIYDYKFKMDSLNRDKTENEIMILEVSDKGSKFFSYTQFVYDSTMTATFKQADMTQQRHFDFTGLKNAKIKHRVTKTYPDYHSLFRTNISATKLTLEGSPKFQWKIEPERSTILGYKTQKASADFQGRKWIAWFSNEIPIQDGPYRFFGLPGLILKLEDSMGDHVFTLIGTKNLNGPSDLRLPFEKTAKEIVVTEEKFNGLWNDYKKDPAKDYRQRASSNSTVTASLSFGGKTISGTDMLKNIEKEGKERLKTENNFIELKLYK